jgi:hypothetical protein
MISKRTFLSLSLFILTASCASSSAPKRPQVSELSLTSADGIQLGSTHQEEITQRFGKPSLAVDLPSRPMKALLYCEKEPCTQGHLTFHVDKDTGAVKSIVWNPQPTDQKNLQAVLDHYKGAIFKKQRYLYDYGDYMYEAETYTNQEQGITIGFDPYKNEVTRVYREDPKSPPPIVASSSKFPVITELPDRGTAASH